MTIRVERSWQALLARLQDDRQWRSIIVLGPVDSGKTTLCRYLGRELAKSHRTAAIDCDPGQSVLGPPAALGLAWEPWDGKRVSALRFVGSTTPSGHLLQTLTGVKRLVDQASEDGAQRIVLDSSGYGSTGALREFHYQTLDLLEPDYLVALQQADELEPLLGSFARRVDLEVCRLPISQAVVGRDPTERRAYRHRKFRQYFEGAAVRTLSLDGVGFHGMVPATDSPERFRTRLVALCDRRGFVVVMGIIEGLRLDEGCLELYAPPFAASQVASVQLGSIRLDRDGRELYYGPPGGGR